MSMSMLFRFMLALLVLTFTYSYADARPKHRAKSPRAVLTHLQPEGPTVFGLPLEGAASASRSVQYMPHPAGCPRRAFCGCGAAVYLFGKPIRDLWLAANWIYKFPRAHPAPRMAAARSGHVFVLISHVSGDIWQVYDANSGGRKTRIHHRSIRGYTIVNPYASRYAEL